MRLFDAHFHVIDPRFPLVPNEGFLPEPFTVEDYLERAVPLGVIGGAVVSGSFQAFDQSYLVAALRQLGPSFVGVTQLPATATDEEIRALDREGVRAVRFNLRRGGSEGLDRLEVLARRVHALVGWHVELYVDSRELDALAPTLASLPAVSIDHLGLSAAGFPALLRLAERGARAKATGFGRLDFDPIPRIVELLAANPDSVVFGTDLPSTRAPRPFADADVRRITDALEPELAERVLVKNALALYRPAGPAPPASGDVVSRERGGPGRNA